MRDMLRRAVGWMDLLSVYESVICRRCTGTHDYTLKWPPGQTVNDILGSRRGGQWVAQEKCAGERVVGGGGGVLSETGGDCKTPLNLEIVVG